MRRSTDLRNMWVNGKLKIVRRPSAMPVGTLQGANRHIAVRKAMARHFVGETL